LDPAGRAQHPAELRREAFPAEEKRGRLRLIVSPDRAGSLLIHQDARVYAGLFDGMSMRSSTWRPEDASTCTWRADR
jgi:hypothetical protein